MVYIGDFPHNSRFNRYEVKADIRGTQTVVYVSDASTKDFAVLNSRLNGSLNWINTHFDSILDFCVENLLKLKNEAWTDENSPAVTAEEFKAQLQLTSISIEDDSDLRIAFYGDDLFAGHWVVVYTDKDFHLIEAVIEG